MSFAVAAGCFTSALISMLGCCAWFAPKQRELEADMHRLEGDLSVRLAVFEAISEAETLEGAKKLAKFWAEYPK